MTAPKPVHGTALAHRLCTALGVDADHVIAVTIHAGIDGPATITVVRAVTNLAAARLERQVGLEVDRHNLVAITEDTPE